MGSIANSDRPQPSLLKWSLFLVPLVIAMGFLSGQIAGDVADNQWFQALDKPPIFPPPALFGIVWSILYAMMGFAMALICVLPPSKMRVLAIVAFSVQLALNLWWSPLFFALHQIYAAFLLMLLLDAAIVITIMLFIRLRPLAGLLLLPYLAWALFATVLTSEFERLNPDADAGPLASAAQVV